MTEFDPFEMCRILNEEKVEYVVLGGFAAILRGRRSPHVIWMSFRIAQERISTASGSLLIE